MEFKVNTKMPVDVIGMEDHDVSVHAEDDGDGDPCQLEDLQEGVEEVREERGVEVEEVAAGAEMVRHEHQGDNQLQGQVAVARGRRQEVILDVIIIKIIQNICGGM